MSANAQKQVDTLLRQQNFRLVRQAKHRVWRNPDGKVFVTAATPSDWRAVKNQITVLKHVIASDPVPEVVAISEFERREALAKLARQEKKAPGAAAGPAKSKGCGYTYIEKKPEVISTLTPEQKQAEREQRALELLVRKARQEFVASIVAKHRVLAPKLKEEFQRRCLEYADNRLAFELRRHYDREKRGRRQAGSQMNRTISGILEARAFQVDRIIGAAFDENCGLCEKKDGLFYYCFNHVYERYRAVALNIEKFMHSWPAEDVAKDATKMFNEMMRSKIEGTVAQGRGIQGHERGILMRYAVRKANELTKQLLASRPMKSAA